MGKRKRRERNNQTQLGISHEIKRIKELKKWIDRFRLKIKLSTPSKQWPLYKLNTTPDKTLKVL